MAEVRTAARRAALGSIAALTEIRDDLTQPGGVRAAAADRLLQWAYGPPRPSLSDSAPLAELSDEALDELVDELDEQQEPGPDEQA